MSKPILIVRVANGTDMEKMARIRTQIETITKGEYHVIVLEKQTDVSFEVFNGDPALVKNIEEILGKKATAFDAKNTDTGI